MALLKALSSFQNCLLHNGVYYKFDLGGSLVDSGRLTSDLIGGATQVGIISVITSNGYTELATDKAEVNDICARSIFTKYKFNGASSIALIQALQTRGGFRYIFTRKGVQDGVRFTQAFFIYDFNIDINQYLQGLDISILG